MQLRGDEAEGNAIGYADNTRPNFILRGLSCLLLLSLIISLVIYGPHWGFIGLIIISAASVLYAALKLLACLTVKPKNSPEINPGEWPFYTVLVPLFREANMVEGLMHALSLLDYPKDRLEIFIICEIIDTETIEEVRKHIEKPFQLIIVPKGQPQTKPRALNFALASASGEFVTIFDAEDAPHPGQLKQAVAAFHGDEKLGAVQAPLDYANADENWLTRQFALEYAALFHVWLPFLAKYDLPFPLGGTSNHMRRSAIIGGWDAHNVTEDADLGFRLAANNWSLGYILPPTDEEAVGEWKAWHLQRSRWVKGYMQTWIVHMRHPFLPSGRQGVWRFIMLQITVGFPIINALFHLPALAIITLWSLYQYVIGQEVHIPAVYAVSFGFSYAMGILMGIIGAIRSGRPSLVMSAFGMPIYWLALCWPAFLALWELWYKPFYWHKTDHGVTGRRKLTSERDQNVE